ncbi:MAG: VTT domain-containing protein [Pseudomonadota bacterium]
MGVWGKSETLTTLIYVASSLVLLIAIVSAGDEVWRHINTLESWVANLGPWSFVVFVLLFAVLSSLFFPDTLLGIAAGTMFGFPQAVATVTCGSLAGALLQYVLSRRILKPVINKFLLSKPRLSAIQSAVLRQELRLQFLIRLTPLNRALISYVLGAAGVSLPRFMLAYAAILPNLCVEVYFGFAGKHLSQVGQPQHVGFLHDVMLALRFVVAISVMVAVSRMAKRAVEDSI